MEVSFAKGDDYQKLYTWQNEMANMISKINHNIDEDKDKEGSRNDTGEAEVNRRESMVVDKQEPESEFQEGVKRLGASFLGAESNFTPVEVEGLLQDQRCAYDIIDWHLNKMLKGNEPQQLLMIIPGKGGVGKSKTIQTITENFVQRGAVHLLAKSVYTGITVSIIDGKMLHVICQIPLNHQNQSRKSNQKLAQFWHHKLYLIIDKKSMLSHKFLARVSSAICTAKNLAGVAGSELPFGGVNIILISNFHQFSPVTGRPLYWPLDPLKDNGEDLLGHSLYEQFQTVVCLKQQVRVIDEEWLDLLQHVRNGSCRTHHLHLLHSLILTDS